MKKKTGFREKDTCYNLERNYSIPYSKERPLSLMHMWHLSTIPSFSEEYFAEHLKWW